MSSSDPVFNNTCGDSVQWFGRCTRCRIYRGVIQGRKGTRLKDEKQPVRYNKTSEHKAIFLSGSGFSAWKHSDGKRTDILKAACWQPLMKSLLKLESCYGFLKFFRRAFEFICKPGKLFNKG